MLHLELIHWLTLALTIAAVTAAGAVRSRRTRGAAGFSLGGRRCGTGLVAGAIMGSAVGGGATVGTAQLAFQYGLPAWCFMLGIGLGLAALGLLFAAPLRRSGLETVPQFLVLQYGKTAGPVVSLISCCGIFFACAASMLPAMALLEAVFHLSPAVAAALICVLVVAYIGIGGQRGAGVSGMLKAAVLWSALLLAAVAAGRGLAAPAAPALPQGYWSLVSRGPAYTFSCLGATAMGMMTAQMYIQALYSAVDVRTARNGALLGAVLCVPVGLMSCLAGMYMRAHYPDMNPLLALPTFLLQEVPAAVGGVALGGIVLAVISSAAAQVLAIGTMVARDVAGNLLRVENERRLVGINRAALALAAVAVAVFCLWQRDSNILTWNYLSMALRGGGIFLPLLLAVLLGERFTRRLSAKWVLLSMVGSTAASMAAALWLNMPPTAVGLGCSALLLGAGVLGKR